MNNRECSVVRDLMPLCIDSAASENSRELVVKHVWECEDCAKVYSDMQGKLLPGPQEEADYLDEAARRLRRKRRNRRRLLIAMTALLTAVLIVAGFFGYQYAFHGSHIPLGPDEYEAVLSRTQDGHVLLHILVKDKYLSHSISAGGQMEADGTYTLTVTPHTQLVRKYFSTPTPPLRGHDLSHSYWQDGQVWIKRPHWQEGEPMKLTCIRIVSSAGEHILYEAGDDIPLCSPEMDAYYQALTEFETIDAEASQRLDALSDQMAELSKLVPEWQ